MAREVVAERAPLAIRAGKTIELCVDATPVLRQGNLMALEQALGNLIDNALRFTPPGGMVEVEVTAAGELLVRDRGPGLGDHDPARLFEPFARGPGRRDAEGGAGLGLAIVRDTAEVHGRQGDRLSA